MVPLELLAATAGGKPMSRKASRMYAISFMAAVAAYISASSSSSSFVFTTLKTSQRLGHDVPDEHTIAQRIQGTRPSMLCDFCLVEGK